MGALSVITLVIASRRRTSSHSGLVLGGLRIGVGGVEALLGAVEGHLDRARGQAQGMGDLGDGEAVARVSQQVGAL